MVVNIIVVYFLSVGATIGNTFHMQYRHGYRRTVILFFTYFSAKFDTNTFVISCISLPTATISLL